MIENIKEKVKQAYQNNKLVYPLVDEMCEEINGTETDIENLEVTDLGSGNASAGKVATADGSGNVEWQNVPNELPSHGEGDVGKVLKVGSEGVEWGSASGVHLYRHVIFFNAKGCYMEIYSTSPNAYTLSTLISFMGDARFPLINQVNADKLLWCIAHVESSTLKLYNNSVTDWTMNVYSYKGTDTLTDTVTQIF